MTDDVPFLIAAVRKEHKDIARELARKRAIKDRKAGNAPEFYVVWDPSVLSKEDYVKIVVSLGNIVRKHGGVGVVRLKNLENQVENLLIPR